MPVPLPTPLRTTLPIGLLLLALWTPVPDAAAQAPERDVRALVVKTVKDVRRRAPDAAWREAVPLDPLRSGYEVQTAEGSLALIRFADETKLVVREQTLLSLRGLVRADEIVSREVQVTEGRIAFSVKRQPNEAFRFTSPTAVASIRGTRGAFALNGGATLLIITEGLGRMQSASSSDSVDVRPGQAGVVEADGRLVLREATSEELSWASDYVGEGRIRRLVVPGEDRNGQSRSLLFEWEEE